MGQGLLQRQRRNGQGQTKKPRTHTFKTFKGMNQTDARVAIKDDEFAWLENAMTIGDGAIQILNGPGTSIANFSQGVVKHEGFVLNGAAITVVVGADGSLTQVTIPAGVKTVMGGAATVTSSVSFAIWQGTTILILDPTKGYMSWDGTTFTVIDAARKGTSIAVFQGRAALINGRTINLTAPNTFSDFNAANGATSTVLTDEAFPGNITAAVSALEQLWLVGAGAVEALANIVTLAGPPITTTFSITNIVTNLGSNAQHTVLGYFRALAFAAPFGVYALSGVTPQKISEKLDGLFPFLTIDSTSSSAVVVLQNLLCLIFNVTYTGQTSIAGPGPRPLQLIFTGGKWCLSSQGNVVWISSVLVGGVAQAWATDGAGLYQLYGASASTPVPYKVQWKLSDFGDSTRMKSCIKSGMEFQASIAPSPTLIIENEAMQTEPESVQTTSDLIWLNTSGGILTWLNNASQVLTWKGFGTVLSRQVSNQYGRYLGWSLYNAVGDAPYLIQAISMQVRDEGEWVTPGTGPGAS